MTTTASPHLSIAHRSLRAQHIEEVSSRFLAQRPLIIGVAGVALCSVLWVGPIPLAQAIGVSVGVSVVWASFFHERRVAQRRHLSAMEFERSLLWTTCAITMLSCATGGLFSPMLPIFFAPVVTTFAAFGRGKESRHMMSLMVIAALLLGGATLMLPELRIIDPYRTLLLVCTSLTSLTLLYLSVTGVMRALDRSAFELDAMRRTQHQRALRRAEDMEAMSARAAHELKNPLSTIKGLVQLEARQHNSNEARRTKRFDMIMHEVERSQSLIQEHLTLARRMTDLQSATHTLTELGTMLSNLANTSTHAHPDKPTHIHDNLSELDLSRELIVDLDKLHQTMANLIENAQHATQEGEVRISIALDEPDAVRLCVEDDGEGMSAELLSQIGSPYFTGKTEGTGLGILIARAIVVQHGGELNHTSEPGAGTTAHIRLPLIHIEHTS